VVGTRWAFVVNFLLREKSENVNTIPNQDSLINLSFIPADLHLIQNEKGFLITMRGRAIYETKSQQTALLKYHWIRGKVEKNYAAHQPTAEEKKELLLKQIAESVVKNERIVSRSASIFPMSPDALLEVELALDAYCAAVENSPLSLHAQHNYIDPVNQFVRWIKGDFVPGSRILPMRPKRKRGPAA
jgi:hypothetical protein